MHSGRKRRIGRLKPLSGNALFTRIRPISGAGLWQICGQKLSQVQETIAAAAIRLLRLLISIWPKLSQTLVISAIRPR